VPRKRYRLSGGLLGFAVVLVLSVLAGATGGGLAVFLGGLLFAVFLGAPLGMLGGHVASRLPRPIVQRPRPGAHEIGRLTVGELTERERLPHDVWRTLAEACHDSVQRAGDAITLAPDSAATEWLWQLYDRMVAELPKVDALASLARIEFPHELATASPAAREHELHAQLAAAAAEFESSRQRVSDIVARLLGHPDLGEITVELRTLEIELPVLGEPDLG
jgi:hypothetical protein